MSTNTKQPWVRPEVTAVTASGSRSDTPDAAARNGFSQQIIQ